MLAAEMGVQSLHGVGTQRARQLQKLRIDTVEDLLLHYPRSYIDLSVLYELMSAPVDEACAVLATVVKKSGEIRLKNGMKMYKVTIVDDTGTMELTFFNTKFAVDSLAHDTPYIFYGRIEGNLLHRRMNAPMIFPVDAEHPFIAVYSLTSGLSLKVLSGLMAQALDFTETLVERLPLSVRSTYNLEEIGTAVAMIHRPHTQQKLAAARRRLIFEELFTLAVGIGMLKSRTKRCIATAMHPHIIQPFYDALPFILTDAQQRAIAELTFDMCRKTPANRLVQGDVGSGKTMVAMAGAYFAFLSQAQSALMAPTELLARQHYEGLSLLAEKLGMRLGLLVGSMSAVEKRNVYHALESGEIDLCIGTHALLSEGVAFQQLALVITDEQHRFGVDQRAALQRKGYYPHTLVMSATPIPRTLALMVYGELDISIIDQLPPNRKQVQTYKISSAKRERAFGFIKEHLDKGLQGYIVCPLVEQGEETSSLQAASSYAIELGAKHFSGYTVGLLHGRMKAADKERTMAEFKSGDIQLLISTTVVEVGVDVPNAVVMMVENAERFGLSQLHQLRGRVGRGKEQSYCILLSDSRSKATLERLHMMCKTNDGFALAEYDLKVRGPGDVLGQQQHGLPQLRIADLTSDAAAVSEAQQAAAQLLREDPMLEAAEHSALREAVQQLFDRVGDRPN